MSVLRRYGGTESDSFITCVTYERRPILIEYASLFWSAVAAVKQQSPFELIAYVILPDHLHIIIGPGKGSMDNLMQRIKMSFGSSYRLAVGLPSGRVWQHRYWDHVIRDQIDMNQHIDYIHFNPVKHGLTSDPWAWEHSSLHCFFQQGLYKRDWGTLEAPRFEGEYGE